MTENEAIEHLRVSEGAFSKRFTDCVQTAIQALEKQIPKKPKKDEYCGFVDYACPICGRDVGDSRTKYCRNCGQRLEWKG